MLVIMLKEEFSLVSLQWHLCAHIKHVLGPVFDLAGAGPGLPYTSSTQLL